MGAIVLQWTLYLRPSTAMVFERPTRPSLAGGRETKRHEVEETIEEIVRLASSTKETENYYLENCETHVPSSRCFSNKCSSAHNTTLSLVSGTYLMDMSLLQCVVQ